MDLDEELYDMDLKAQVHQKDSGSDNIQVPDNFEMDDNCKFSNTESTDTNIDRAEEILPNISLGTMHLEMEDPENGAPDQGGDNANENSNSVTSSSLDEVAVENPALIVKYMDFPNPSVPHQSSRILFETFSVPKNMYGREYPSKQT